MLDVASARRTFCPPSTAAAALVAAPSSAAHHPPFEDILMKRLALGVAIVALAAWAGGEADRAGSVDSAEMRRLDSIRADSLRRDSIARGLIDTTGAAKTAPTTPPPSSH